MMIKGKLYKKGVSNNFSKAFLTFFLLFFFYFISFLSYSTHIVGGALTYEYNGGSSYTITLKLYRDCGSGSAAFPDPVVISVRGYDGATFSPGRDISINLGTVTPVPSNLDTCADPPNPMPCVEEGIYSITVDDLPPNPGGYHLFYQKIARNLSLTNIDATCNCIGESFYAYIPGTNNSDIVWNENFTLANGTTSDAGVTAWSITNGATPPNYAEVQGNLFEVSGADNGLVTWTSQVIDISAFPVSGVNVSVGLSETTTLETNDSILVYYSLDGGAWTIFTNNGFFANDFGTGVSNQLGLIGNNVQIRIVVQYDGASSNEIYRIDNVLVSGNDFTVNDNAVFTLFPPLFLCVGQPFSFDHSATDVNGDSLVYSFYTPYDGDDASGGPLDPTFSNNTAIFQPIVYEPGYTFTNPLGGSPLNLSSSSGLLSGTPTTIGQYVVGVMVKEYRNGICIDSTLRDFQFNVVDCPLPATAVLPDTTFACSGLAVSFSNLGNPSTNNWWDFGDPAATDDTSVLANPSYNYPVEGYYNVVLITNKGTFCADSDTTVVLVAWVDAGFMADTVGCAGDFFDFNDTSSGSSNLTITGYEWNFGDGNTSLSMDTSNIYISDGSYTVTHIVTTDLGCSDTVTNTVDVNPAPVFVVDMTGDPDSVWTSPSVVRDCKVCGATGVSMVCITFILTLDAGTQAISFDLTSGAVPPGALYYQINCGDSFPVGDTICISGVGPHQITFCKPGNNPNEYTITAITAPEVSPPITVSDGCMDTISAKGYIETSVTWTSVSPGVQGSYDAYLDCPSGCDTVIVTSQPGYPPSVDYMVCGLPVGGGSCSVSPVCDTTTVFFVTTLGVAILPQNPTICFGGANTSITANPSGGASPYSYLWSTGETSASISVGVGTFYVTVSDTTDCQPVTDSVVVTAFPSAITANAGPDQTVCNNYPEVILSGVVTAASGGTWFGGGGTFSPSEDSLNSNYTPTPAEITAGSMQLFLVTTGNGSCPSDTDTMMISFIYFTATVSVSSTDALCFGDSAGTASSTVSGGFSPITYMWSTGATTTSISNLPAALYNLTVTESNGCDTILSITIAQPDSFSYTFNISSDNCCNKKGAATIFVSGGTPPFSYFWNNGDTVLSTFTDSSAIDSLISSASFGFYTVMVTDANGCTISDSVWVEGSGSPPDVTTSTTPSSCSGSCNGTAFANPSGGTSPYTYDWSTGSTTQGIANLCAGDYGITITDSLDCKASSIASVLEPTPVIASISFQTNVSCNGGNNGSATALGGGGTSPYNYSWSNGTTTSTANNLISNIYDVTVTDANSCTNTASVTITEPSSIILSTSSTNVSCNGGNNGSATATANGGISPYNFIWSTGASTASINNLQSNIYNVTVTDGNTCTKISSVTITEPSPILLSTSSIPVLCNGGADGSATANPSGGTPGYTYQWSNGSNGASINGLASGNYSVTVSDSNGCEITGSIFVNEPPILTISATFTPVSCKGGNTGTASATGSGGTLSYTFDWSNGQSGSTINNLTAGTYSVTVTDGNGCTKITSVTITEPAVALSATASATNALCNGVCNGTLNANASGGTGSYSFAWSGGLGSGANKTNVCPGTYTVTATDVNGCTATSSATINEPSVLLASATSTDALCKDSCNGSLTVSASGGTAGYSFSWSGGFGTGNNKSGICAGNYFVTVTDANGCTDTSSVEVSEPALLSSLTSVTEVSCFGGNNGTATVSSSGGISPYSYQWSNFQSDSTATGLSTDVYEVTVTDSNGCTSFASATVNQPSLLIVTIDSSTNVSCNNGNDGMAVDGISGGTTPYSYLWSSGSNQSSAQNLSAGTYYLSVADANSCVAIDSVVITEPATSLSSNTSSSSVLCKGDSNGTATVTPFGATSPYSFQWDMAANSQTDSTATGLIAGTYNVTITDNNNCIFDTAVTVTEPATLLSLDTSSTLVICNGDDDGTATVTPSGGISQYTYLWDVNAGSQTDSTATGLVAGTYGVTVSDNNGCIMDTIVFVDQPFSPLSVFLSSDSVNCFGGNDGFAVVSPSGGTPPYSYQWDDAAFQTDSIATGLMAGIYSVTVTDNTGNCKVGNGIFVSQPDSLGLYPSSVNVSCYGGNDGTASVFAFGGTSPYLYFWSNNQSTPQISNLISQTYSVTVTDQNNCLDSTVFFITQPASPLNISSLVSSDVKCNGGNDGQASVSVSGGTSPYVYLWDDNNQTITSNVSGLYSGSYIVIIEDSNGCLIDTSVVISEPSPGLAISLSSTDVNCFGGNDGTATISPSGGTSPYFYLWDSFANNQTDSTATGLITGTYSVTVTDNNGCILDTNSAVFVGQPATYISVVTSQTEVSCFGDSDGTATLTVSGGTPPYAYQWSNGDTIFQIFNLSAQIYFATVTDDNGCADDTISVLISEPMPLEVIISSTNVICKGENNGSATISTSGGTIPYSFQWDSAANLQTDSLATGLIAGTYFVSVTDSNNCLLDTMVTISEPADSLIFTTSVSDVVCFGDSNGTATITPSGGVSPYFYQWDLNSGLQSGSTATGLKPGSYYVTITDNGGCSDSSASVIILEPQKVLAIASEDTMICPGQNATITADGTGGTGVYTYEWNIGNGQNQTVSPTSNTIYTVTVSDSKNCKSISDSVNVFVRNYYFDSLKFSCGTAVNCILCPGESTQISASYFEEFPPYSYIWPGLGNGLGPFTVSPDTTTEYRLIVSDQCGSFSSILTLYVDSFPKISLPVIYADDCEPLTVSFQNSIQNPSGSQYFWNFGDGGISSDSMPVHPYDNDGTYIVSLIINTPNNCSDTADTATTVIVRPLPEPNCQASPETATLQNPVINFQTGSFTTYYWDFGDGDSSNSQKPVHTYRDSGEYNVIVKVTNQYNCENSCEVVVRINPNYPLGIPNAFTPNPNGPNGGTYSFDDFTNNVFFPITRYVTDYHLEIFNRWGELLFESFDINRGWDGYYRGDLCQQDVYVWKIYLKWWDGQEFNEVGDVTLIR